MLLSKQDTLRLVWFMILAWGEDNLEEPFDDYRPEPLREPEDLSWMLAM